MVERLGSAADFEVVEDAAVFVEVVGELLNVVLGTCAAREGTFIGVDVGFFEHFENIFIQLIQKLLGFF